MEMAFADAAVLGGGSWGTALAETLARSGRRVALVMRDRARAETLNATRRNPRYLSEFMLSPGVRATADPVALRDAALVVLAVPCQGLREALCAVRGQLAPGAVLVNAAKGVEVARLALPSRIVAEECPTHAARYAVLSGPSFAREVMADKPTAVVLGCADAVLGASLRAVFATGRFRAYSCADVTGVELGGGVKNVIALAAGICDGLGFGDNARAALITRGLAEMRRLGAALGARQETLMGLSGLGDLLLTCAGDLSRNRQVGLRLAQGLALEDIVQRLGMVAEGVKTTVGVRALAGERGVEMPVTEAVYEILYNGLAPFAAVERLLARPLREE